MSNTTIDTLQLDIVVNSNKATSNLKETTTQVDKLTRTMTTHKDGILQTETEYKKVGNEIEQVIRKYNKLGEVISTVTKVGSTQKEVAPKQPEVPEDFTKTSTNIVDGLVKSETIYSRIQGAVSKVTTSYNEQGQAIRKVTESIDNLGNKTVSAENLTQKEVQETESRYKKLSDTIKKGGSKSGSGGIAKSLNFGAMIGKLYFIRNITKRLSDNLAKMVQYGIDFTETLNLWQTAVRGNISEARSFVSEMNKAYGIAEQTLMKYQAAFKNMLSAMGKISEDTAYGLSEALTKMALDFSSLYNVSIESAMNKFQAVLSGQVRPIRSISGYDITENTIFDIYKGLGGQKTMRQLDQTEKRLLRIYAVFQQMGTTGALGDMEKTLYTNANQLRTMKEQAIEFATWIGNGISYLVQESEILIKINTYLYTAKELAKSLAYELGYREENFMTGFVDSTEEANEEIDKLQGKLLGFDKFETLGGGTAETDISIEDMLVNAMKNYQSLLTGFVNPAQKKSVELLKQMGYELKYYAEVGDKTFEGGNLEEYNKWLETLTDSEKKGVKVTEVWGKTTDWVNNAIDNILSAMPLLKNILKEVVPIAKLFEPIIANIIELLKPILNLIKALLPIVKNILGYVINILMPVIEPAIDNVISAIEFITALLTGDLKGALKSAGDFLLSFGNIATGVFNGIIDIITGVVNAITNAINSVIGALNKISFKIPNWVPFFGGKEFGLNIKYIPQLSTPKMPTFANGGGFNTADLFYANENGNTELVASNNRGGAVMNMQQLENAVYSGMIMAMSAQQTSDKKQQININYNASLQALVEPLARAFTNAGYKVEKV